MKMWIPIRSPKLGRRICLPVRKSVPASKPLPAPTWKSAPLPFPHPSFPPSKLEESVSLESPSSGLSRLQIQPDLVPSEFANEFTILTKQFLDQRTTLIDSYR